MKDERPEVLALFAAIKRDLPQLRELQDNARCMSEDLVYRFYHQSFKVYFAQSFTKTISAALQALAPERALHGWFREIVADGTPGPFDQSHNAMWLKQTRRQLEAFWHALYFLDQVVRYGTELEEPPTSLPSGWAAVLYLYGLR